MAPGSHPAGTNYESTRAELPASYVLYHSVRKCKGRLGIHINAKAVLTFPDKQFGSRIFAVPGPYTLCAYKGARFFFFFFSDTYS